jgi:hypothetical protein
MRFFTQFRGELNGLMKAQGVALIVIRKSEIGFRAEGPEIYLAQASGLGTGAVDFREGRRSSRLQERGNPIHHDSTNGRAVGPRLFSLLGYSARWAGLGKLAGRWPCCLIANLCVTTTALPRG